MTPVPLLTQKQVAEVLGLSLRRVQEITEGAELPVVRIGRAVRVRPADLERFIAARTERSRHERQRPARPTSEGRT